MLLMTGCPYPQEFRTGVADLAAFMPDFIDLRIRGANPRPDRRQSDEGVGLIASWSARIA